MVYEYKVPYTKVSAQEAGEELARIECEHGGLTPELVVDASREESAPLHPVFEWNDRKAAERYRIVQAGSLIRNVTVKIEEAPRMEPVRAFVMSRQSASARACLSVSRARWMTRRLARRS